MSIEALDWAFKLRLEDPLAKVVLLALANHYNPKSEICWPSFDLLVRETGASKRTLTRAIQRLERLALINVDRHPRKSNVYLLHCDGWLPSGAFDTGATEEDLGLIGISVRSEIISPTHVECQSDALGRQSGTPEVSESLPSLATLATHPCHSGTLIIRETSLNLSRNRSELEDFFGDVEMRSFGWTGPSRWNWEHLDG